MNHLAGLLDRAAGPITAPADHRPDLARGRRALSRTRRRRTAAGLAGLAAAGAVGMALAHRPTTDDTPVAAVELDRRSPFNTPGFRFFANPDGWEVQGATRQSVTFAPVGGGVSEDPLDFEGKLVVLFDTSAAAGNLVVVDGRDYWLAGDSGVTMISDYTRPGEPRGRLIVQVPVAAGWTTKDLAAFIDTVQVRVGAALGPG